MSTDAAIAESIRELALEEGFADVGITPAVESTGYSQLVQWIQSGHAAGMSYFAERLEAYRHPRGVLPGVKSLIALRYPYDASSRECVDLEIETRKSLNAEALGRVARYAASGADYHDLLHPNKTRLCKRIQALAPEANARGVVDTAPLPEREVAVAAGLGWIGKNTLLLNRKAGSYFFLACVLVDIDLPADQPHESSHCGSCTACLRACPTDAFPEPGVLNASRCISYLTIEHRGEIPPELRSGIQDWVFGCDVCQEVCPWNHKPSRRQAQRVLRLRTADLQTLLQMDEDTFRHQFRRTPFWRTRRPGMARNAAIVLGNLGNRDAVPCLAQALRDCEPSVRGAAAWALGKLAGEDALAFLKDHQTVETDPVVHEEIAAAIRTAIADPR